ncbi:hypothetical protein JZ751_016659 [Albula glossodonta]|uniref:Uncharacterized protein n=1 Tax=Albula glossodonta TaxID=121402 RepID=A0A8T2MKE0_9TELE|nr:hypothetical protein JZ751_016659 [Albula glossodonta]
MVAIPSRKSVSAGMESVMFILSATMCTGRCTFMPWLVWMKNSLGFPTREGHLSPEKGPVSCSRFTLFPSTPCTRPRSPWLSTQTTKQSIPLWSFLLSSSIKDSIRCTLQSRWICVSKPSQSNTCFRFSEDTPETTISNLLLQSHQRSFSLFHLRTLAEITRHVSRSSVTVSRRSSLESCLQFLHYFSQYGVSAQNRPWSEDLSALGTSVDTSMIILIPADLNTAHTVTVSTGNSHRILQ